MFTNPNPIPAMNSVTLVEGLFKIHKGLSPEIHLVMMYSNKSTGVSMGTCPVMSALLSEKTLSAFQAFIDSAEEDWGSFILSGGYLAAVEGRPQAMGMAESSEGIKPIRGLGEG